MKIFNLVYCLLIGLLLSSCSKSEYAFDEHAHENSVNRIDGNKLAKVYIEKAKNLYSFMGENSSYVKNNISGLPVNWASSNFYYNKKGEKVLAASFSNKLGERVRYSAVFVYDSLSNDFKTSYIFKYIPSEIYFKTNKGLSDYSAFSGRIEIYDYESLLRIDSVENGYIATNIFNNTSKFYKRDSKDGRLTTSNYKTLGEILDGVWLNEVNVYATEIIRVYCIMCGELLADNSQPSLERVPDQCPECGFCLRLSMCGLGGGGTVPPPNGGGPSTPPPSSNIPGEIKNGLTNPCMKAAINDALSANTKIEGKLADIIKKFDSTKSIKINVNDGNIYYPNGSPKPGQTSNMRFEGSQFSADITLGIEYHTGTSRESLAATLIHEVVHAYLGYTSNNFLITQNHNVIAENYITPMAEYLHSAYNITLKEAYGLAWSGVPDSKAWKDASDDFEFTMSDGNKITKSEATYLPLPFKDLNTEPTSKGSPICP